MKPLALVLIVQLVSVLAMPAELLGEAEDMTEKEKIEALIEHIEGLEHATFIRNGREYDSEKAARFLRGKWRVMGKRIQSASEFIEKIASESSTFGTPYRIRFGDREEVLCGDYLKQRLEHLDRH